jgi:hypothetical protein
MSFFTGGGWFYLWKKNPLTKKEKCKCSPHQYWGAWKKNQILAKIFHLLSSTWTLCFKLPQILGPIQVLASGLKKHDYNNLAFEVHVNKNQEIMHPIFFYYPHKIIYLSVLLFRDLGILLLTLLFVYTLPCFQPYKDTFNPSETTWRTKTSLIRWPVVPK